MELQKEFSASAIGGFKKAEVTAYLDALSLQIDDELAQRQRQIDALQAQMAEMKSLVDQQYQKIVDLSAASDELKRSLMAKTTEAEELARRLAPFEAAQTEAAAIVASAQKEKDARMSEADAHFAELRTQADALLAEASVQGKAVLGQANEQAALLLQGAKEKAQGIVNDARRQGQELLDDARSQIEQNVSLSEENEARSRRVLENAQQEAEAILLQARLSAREKQEYYDECLHRLEEQRNSVLSSLEEIRKRVEAIPISQPPQGGKDPADVLRQNNAEAIRRKFEQLNRKDR